MAATPSAIPWTSAVVAAAVAAPASASCGELAATGCPWRHRSLALGGALRPGDGHQTELLLVLLGGLFVIVALSVLIQVGSSKLTGRRCPRWRRSSTTSSSWAGRETTDRGALLAHRQPVDRGGAPGLPSGADRQPGRLGCSTPTSLANCTSRHPHRPRSGRGDNPALRRAHVASRCRRGVIAPVEPACKRIWARSGYRRHGEGRGRGSRSGESRAAEEARSGVGPGQTPSGLAGQPPVPGSEG